jgi:hypothetical protein
MKGEWTRCFWQFTAKNARTARIIGKSCFRAWRHDGYGPREEAMRSHHPPPPNAQSNPPGCQLVEPRHDRGGRRPQCDSPSVRSRLGFVGRRIVSVDSAATSGDTACPAPTACRWRIPHVAWPRELHERGGWLQIVWTCAGSCGNAPTTAAGRNGASCRCETLPCSLRRYWSSPMLPGLGSWGVGVQPPTRKDVSCAGSTPVTSLIQPLLLRGCLWLSHGYQGRVTGTSFFHRSRLLTAAAGLAKRRQGR